MSWRANTSALHLQELNQHADVVLAGRSKGDATRSYAAGDAEAQRAAAARAQSDLSDLRAQRVRSFRLASWPCFVIRAADLAMLHRRNACTACL